MVAAEETYQSVLDDIERVASWQEKNPATCSRCGSRLGRQPNTSHYDARIYLCDGCAVVDAIVQSDKVITHGREKTERDYLNAQEWTALSSSEE